VYPEFALSVNVIKLFAVIAADALVRLVTESVVPHAFPAGDPEVPNALPRVRPPTVILASFVVAACGEDPPPVRPLKSHPTKVVCACAAPDNASVSASAAPRAEDRMLFVDGSWQMEDGKFL